MMPKPSVQHTHMCAHLSAERMAIGFSRLTFLAFYLSIPLTARSPRSLSEGGSPASASWLSAGTTAGGDAFVCLSLKSCEATKEH